MFLPNRNKKSLRFEMEGLPVPVCRINKNVIPIIIDFWQKKDKLSDFYKAYKDCPLVLVTSAEVVDFLKKNHCPLPIEHWPLSFPDYYKINPEKTYKKDIDFCFIGRPNQFFVRMVESYAEKYPDFVYVMGKGGIFHRIFETNKGELVCKDKGRETYLNMIRRTKITCYTTPGIDESKEVKTTFNQVTPRVFEMLAGGCYIIGHYPDNADTLYYNLQSIMPRVNSYEEFESLMNKYRAMPPRDMKEVEQYLSKHYTSTRVQMLKEILDKYNIEL